MHWARRDLEIPDIGALQAQGYSSFCGFATVAPCPQASGEFPRLQPGETKHSWARDERLLLG